MSQRRFRIESLLGVGATGAVYLAETDGGALHRRVAIKLLRPESAGNEALLRRLRDEARLLAAVRHRAIVGVEDLVELDVGWAIIMEYVEGCDVAELLRFGPLTPAIALAIVEEAAAALDAAFHRTDADGNELKLIHRDIKPSNLRVTAQGETKILDFGVARAEIGGREDSTGSTAYGTVPFMAPERFYGEDSHAGDVYALGVTLFEMLTGVKPGKTAVDADRQPPGVRRREQWTWLEATSQELHHLLAWMLVPDPGSRPSAKEVVRVVSRLRAEFLGESIGEWAEHVVPAGLRRRARTDEPPVGTLAPGMVVRERLRAGDAGRESPTARVRHLLARSATAMGLSFGAVIGAGALAAVGAVGWYALQPHAQSAVVESVALAEPAPPAVPPVTRETAVAVVQPVVQRTAPSQPQPRVVAKPAPLPAAPSAKAPASPPSPPGTVTLAGDAVSGLLRAAGGTFAPGQVPAGTYTLEAALTDGSAVLLVAVEVPPGGLVVIRCSNALHACREQQE